MKLFNLIDKSTQLILCEICQFGDGKIIVRWINTPCSIVIWEGMTEFMSVSCSLNSNRELVQVKFQS